MPEACCPQEPFPVLSQGFPRYLQVFLEVLPPLSLGDQVLRLLLLEFLQLIRLRELLFQNPAEKHHVTVMDAFDASIAQSYRTTFCRTKAMVPMRRKQAKSKTVRGANAKRGAKQTNY